MICSPHTLEKSPITERQVCFGKLYTSSAAAAQQCMHSLKSALASCVPLLLLLLLLLLKSVCTPSTSHYIDALSTSYLQQCRYSTQASVDSWPVPAASSGYNGGPGSVGGNAYAASSYDPYAQSQHAYGAAAMQPAAPSSPYRQQAGGFGGGGGFGSTIAASNPYASSAAPVPGRSPVGNHGLCSSVCVCVCLCMQAWPLGRCCVKWSPAAGCIGPWPCMLTLTVKVFASQACFGCCDM